jgi:hypothetical protein
VQGAHSANQSLDVPSHLHHHLLHPLHPDYLLAQTGSF